MRYSLRGNVDQNTKWDPIFQRDTLNHYMALSLSGLCGSARKRREQSTDNLAGNGNAIFYQSRPEMVSIIRNFTRKWIARFFLGLLALKKNCWRGRAGCFQQGFYLAHQESCLAIMTQGTSGSIW